MMAIEVIEQYGNSRPSLDIRQIVVSMLRSVSEKHKAGLSSIILTSTAEANRSFRRKKVKHSGVKRNSVEALGSYQPAWPGNPAFIKLYVDNMLAQYPASVLRVCFIRELLVAHTLFHEIGHHIHLTKAREFRHREDVADDWADRLTREYFGRRYWYVTRLSRLIVRGNNHLNRYKQRRAQQALGADSP